MSQKNDIPVFPITAWQAGPLPGYGALALNSSTWLPLCNHWIQHKKLSSSRLLPKWLRL